MKGSGNVFLLTKKGKTLSKIWLVGEQNFSLYLSDLKSHRVLTAKKSIRIYTGISIFVLFCFIGNAFPSRSLQP